MHRGRAMTERCIFGCDNPIGVYSVPDGCLCFPRDRMQTLCAQHLYGITTDGPVTLIKDLAPDLVWDEQPP